MNNGVRTPVKFHEPMGRTVATIICFAIATRIAFADGPPPAYPGGGPFETNTSRADVFWILAIVGMGIILPMIRRGGGHTGRPPTTAEFLFYLFLDAANCDAIVGDLEERYPLIRSKFGKRRANFWYWTQAIRSVGPVAWAWAKRLLLKPIIAVIAWAVAKGIIGHDSWVAAVVEVWKRIRL